MFFSVIKLETGL